MTLEIDKLDLQKEPKGLTPLEKEFIKLIRKLDPDQFQMEISYLRKIAGKKD